MNSDTNHLVDKVLLDELVNKKVTGYEPVPSHLFRAALDKLAGQHEATVARHSGGKLSRYAAQRRREKRQEQKNSRRANRGG